MPKPPSAGILVYRRNNDKVEILLGHPGGPYWAKKDTAAWSIPKGQIEIGEDMLEAAYREFKEEIGHPVPEGPAIPLGSFKRQDGKVNHTWAVEGDLDATKIKSNTFTMEWPPKSGEQQEFPELDRADWFELNDSIPKLYKGQLPFIERLASFLDYEIDLSPPQTSLL